MEVLDKPQSQIAAYSPFYAQLAELEKNNTAIVFDYESKKGNKEARSHVNTLRLTKGALERVRKEVKEESLKTGRAIDQEAKEINARIEAMILVHQAKLDEIEQRETDRINKLKERLAALSEIHHDKTVADYKYHIETLETVVIDSTWEEFETEALHARTDSVMAHRKLLTALKKHNAEQAELAKLRQEAEARAQKDRDEAIAKAAEEKAKREAAQLAEKEAAKARQAIIAAENKAKAEREAAERRELELKLQAEQAERRRVEAEQKAVQDAKDAVIRAEKEKQQAIAAEKAHVKALAKAEAAETAKREANKAHVKKINQTALVAFAEGGIDSDIQEEIKQDLVAALKQSLAQPAQEPFAWMRFKDGKPDWSEDCLYTKPNSDDGYFEDPGYELKPIYLASQPQAPVVPEGWKLVPIKPTMPMIEAAKVADDQRPFGIYTAMIAALKQSLAQPQWQGEVDLGYITQPQSLAQSAQSSVEALHSDFLENFEYPDYNAQAMGCGLEDRGITDRYEAMAYGWQEAVDTLAELIQDWFAAAPEVQPSQPSAPVVPEGWKLVPIEPTEAMSTAFDDAHHRACFKSESYRAMLSAAPLHPTEPQRDERVKIIPGVVYVCPGRDIECGDRSGNWCAECPKRAASRRKP